MNGNKYTNFIAARGPSPSMASTLHFAASDAYKGRRIETAIQRYVAKRNLNSDRKDLLDKYLTFGGIEGGPKMFSGGLDADTLENSNAAGIATLTAKHSLAFDTSDPGNQTYVVDFEECLKAFLSARCNIPLIEAADGFADPAASLEQWN